ncbi:MAG: PAS domain S-box protein [Ardenticatenaceae bacterium]|nr:PAS domain S-box protein [Ardenticatenaceae bacterium]
MKPIRTLWRTLTAPHPSLSGEQERRAKLLLELLLFMICTAVLSLLVQFFFPGDSRPLLLATQLLGIGLFLGVYALGRSQHLNWATILFVASFDLFICVGIMALPPINYLMPMYLIIPVILTWMLSSFRQSLVVAVGNLVLLFLLLIIARVPSMQVVYVLVIFYLVTSLLILLFIQQYHYREMQNLQIREANENRLRMFIQEADDWIFSLDENGRIISANDKTCHTLGLSEAELLSKSPVDFVKPGDQRRIKGLLTNLFNNETITSVEVEVPVAPGKNIWLEVRGRILAKDGKVIGTIHIARDITERKRAAWLQQKLNWETTLLFEASQSLSRSLDFEHIYETIYTIILTVMDCPLLVIYRHEPEMQQLCFAHIRQDGSPLDLRGLSNERVRLPEEDPCRQAIASGEMRLLIGETAVSARTALTNRIPALAAPSSPESIAAALILPLKFENQIHNLVQIFVPYIPEYTVDDQRFWESFSQQVAAALATARLLTKNQHEIQERRRAEIEAVHRQAEAEMLRQAAAIINSSLSLNVVLTRILEQLHTAIPYDSASIQQKVGNDLTIRAARGFANDAALVNCSFSVTADLPNVEVLHTLKPLAVADVRTSYPSFDTLAPDYQAEHIVSWLGVPLVVDETVLGMITIDRNTVRPFSDEEIAMTVAFANHASIALRNAHLYEEMESQNVQLEQAVAARTAELQRTTDQIEAIFNNSPDAILLLDPDYNVERVNPALETLFGFQREEVQGKPPFSLATTASRDQFVQAFSTAVASGRPQRLELTARRKDQSLFDVTVALAPIYEQETVTAVVCSLHDISAFKEVERLKDDFVSNVSHELRTPIANLKLHNDLIKLNPQKQEIYLQRQAREIERLTIIIESLLRLSRLDQHNVEVTLTAVNLLTLAQEYIQDRSTQAANAGLTLKLDDRVDLPLAHADPRLVGQVIGIILTNALTYTPAGGTIRFCGHTRQHKTGQWVGLSIHDTGPGIPSSEQNQVFSRFFRGQAGRTSGVPGTGLGLAIAQEIMALHQGEIELISPDDKRGTTFTIWLPVAND